MELIRIQFYKHSKNVFMETRIIQVIILNSSYISIHKYIYVHIIIIGNVS